MRASLERIETLLKRSQSPPVEQFSKPSLELDPALSQDPPAAPSHPPQPPAVPLPPSLEPVPPVSVGTTPPEASEGPSTQITSRSNQHWFGRLSIWIGSLSLLFAGYYLVRYSIDSGLLTKEVRLAISFAFGAFLSLLGLYLGSRIQSSGNERLAGAISGTGIATLYFASYAAVHFHEILGPVQGFALIICITIAAVFLALRLGSAIALLGITGGLLNPLLMAPTVENTLFLYIYLLLVYLAFQILSFRREWVAIRFVALAGTWVWSLYLLLSFEQTGAPAGSMFFVIGVCISNGFLLLHSQPNLSANSPLSRIRLAFSALSFVLGLAQALIITSFNQFGTPDLALFNILALSLVFFAIRREREQGWLAGLSLLVVSLATIAQGDSTLPQQLLWVAPFGLLLYLASFLKSTHSAFPKAWLLLGLGTLPLLLSTLFLNHFFRDFVTVPAPEQWLLLSISIFAILLVSAEVILRTSRPVALSTPYALVAFITLLCGFSQYPDAVWLPSIGGFLFLSLGLLWKSRPYPAHGAAVSIFGLITAVVHLPVFYLSGLHLIGFLRFTSRNLSFTDLYGILSFLIAILVILIAGAERLNARLQRFLQAGLFTLVVFCVTTFFLVIFPDQISIGEVTLRAQDCLTTVLAGLAFVLILLIPNHSFGESVARTLGGLVVFRIIVLHLFAAGAASEVFFWNALLVQFGLPLLAFFSTICLLRARQLTSRLAPYQWVAMALGLIWPTFLVRNFFGSDYLLSSFDSPQELYLISLVWLIVALAYLGFGLWRRSKVIYGGSLVVLLLTIAKVFLVDAGNLSGLYRIVSFLGLGLSLLFVGYFYNRLLSSRTPPESETNA